MSVAVACRSYVKFIKCPQLCMLNPTIQSLTQCESVRYSKHWSPKFKRLRTEKVIRVDLPNYHENEDELTPQEVRRRMLERGLVPPRPWMERTLFICSTGQIFEPYIPPEGDGKLSIVSGGGAKQKLQLLEKKSKSMMAVRKIRSFEEDFDPTKFSATAQDIYIQAHTYLASKDKLKLREIVTDKCYPELRFNTTDKTIHWKFIKSLEPPRVVHARCTHVISNENIFGQVTVRFHTQQQLAIYDRFGRLMHGSEILAKDVLEYIVFEKHLANLYGVWKMHAKIIPDWMPPPPPSPATYVRSDEDIDVGLSKAARIKDAELKKDVPISSTDGEKPLAIA